MSSVADQTHSFGYWLRRRRRALDLTQAQLAASVACSHFAIRKIEADERRPSKALAERLAARLGIPTGEREQFLAAARGAQGTDRLPLQAEPIDDAPPPARATPVPSSPAGVQEQPLPRPSGAAAGFVGRHSELAALEAAAERSRAGVGQVVLLAGQPGIGKTRTAQAIAERSAAAGMGVLWGRCPEEPGAPPYWPWVQLIRTHVERHGQASLGASARWIADIIPELGGEAAAAADPRATTDAAQARFRLFDAMATFWKRAASERGIVLVLDDLHWADASSLRLLEFVAAETANARVLILGTYRDIEVDRRHPLSNTLGELARLPSFEQTSLAGLSLDEARLLVADHQAIDAAALVRLHAQTEGNPLYLAEMARFLATPEAARGGAGRLPAGVRAAIGSRLNRLSPECNRVLANAAVIGREFELMVLARVADEITEDACVRAIEEALAANVIEELAATDAYRFSHALIRETLYEEIPAIRRPRLHHRVAMALEEIYPNASPEKLSRLAFHYGAAMPAQGAVKALEYAQRAAENAMSLFAYEQAAQHFRDALEALSVREQRAAPDPALRCELMIRQGEAQVFAADYAAARDTLRGAADLALASGSNSHLARAAMAFEDASWRPGLSGDESVGLLRVALERIDEHDPLASARVSSSLTRALIFTGALDEAMAAYERAVDAARRAADPVALAGALVAGLSARWEPTRIEARLRAATEAIEVGRRIGDRGCVLQASAWRLSDRLEQGADERFWREYREYARLAEELRQPFHIYTSASFRPALSLMAGDLAASEREANALLRIGERQPGLDAAGVYAMQMFAVRREQGELRELAPIVRHFVATTPASGRWRPGLALVLAELGMLEDARREFDALAARDFTDVPRDGMWVAAITFLAEVCVMLADRRRAPLLYAMLLPYRDRNLLVGTSVACFGAASRLLGMLATAEGRLDEALAHFERAIDFDTTQGAMTWLAHAQFQFAVALRLRRRGSDAKRADALLAEAHAAARQLGLAALAARIAARPAA